MLYSYIVFANRRHFFSRHDDAVAILMNDGVAMRLPYFRWRIKIQSVRNAIISIELCIVSIFFLAFVVVENALFWLEVEWWFHTTPKNWCRILIIWVSQTMCTWVYFFEYLNILKVFMLLHISDLPPFHNGNSAPPRTQAWYTAFSTWNQLTTAELILPNACA